MIGMQHYAAYLSALGRCFRCNDALPIDDDDDDAAAAPAAALNPLSKNLPYCRACRDRAKQVENDDNDVMPELVLIETDGVLK